MIHVSQNLLCVSQRPCSYGNVIVSLWPRLISFCGRMEEEERRRTWLFVSPPLVLTILPFWCNVLSLSFILFLWKMLDSFKDFDSGWKFHLRFFFLYSKYQCWFDIDYMLGGYWLVYKRTSYPCFNILYFFWRFFGCKFEPGFFNLSVLILAFFLKLKSLQAQFKTSFYSK